MRLLSITFILSLFVIACKEVTDAPAYEFRQPDEIVNPNGDSELAIVMRNIHFEANKVGRALENNDEVDLTELKSLAAQLSTAVPTDSTVLDDAYYSFSTNLEQRVERMESEEAVIEFNEMVKTCVACHKNTCPGPISKIQKLKVKA